MEHVNHPKHYNQHPNGIECIDIIRHYTCDIANAMKYLWRAGLKPEIGKEDAEKEIEDLHKALWYIEDYAENFNNTAWEVDHIKRMVKEVTGYSIAQITKGYEENVSEAMKHLLCVGLLTSGAMARARDWNARLDSATRHIQHRILGINAALLDKEVENTRAVLHGQAIDGEDYVSKPACVRETEPEKYDPLNMIIVFGRAYSLSNELRKKENGALRNPCENCDLMYVCFDDSQHPETSDHQDLCRLHQARTNEYYKEVGVAKYSPRFGTVEVVDEIKESELELKRLKEEEN